MFRRGIPLYFNTRKDIKLNLIKPENDIYFHFDTLQISRCFSNLIKNAIEAVKKYLILQLKY